MPHFARRRLCGPCRLARSERSFDRVEVTSASRRRAATRSGRLIGVAGLLWITCAVWNSVKPLPPGTHVASLSERLAESQVDFIDDLGDGGAALARELSAIGRADQTVVLDQSPLAPELFRQLLRRKRQRPNLKIVLVTDPRNEAYGGTPADALSALEAAGVVVARTRLERMRDGNPLYSSLWRLSVEWWSNPFDEPPNRATVLSSLRSRNAKANQRDLLAADDGAGGWISIVTSTSPAAASARSAGVGLEIRGHLARDIVASELRIAEWSTGDDRLPTPPPLAGRGVGMIDGRFLTEGAIQASLLEAVAPSGAGDSIDLITRRLSERRLLEAMLRAAGRGVHLRLLLDPDAPETQAAAGELRSKARNIEIRWQYSAAVAETRYVLIRHRNDVLMVLGSADLSRRALGDLNLAAAIELRMPTRAAPARAATAVFEREWARAATYLDHADESAATYWRYRFADATGLAMF